MDVSTTPLPQFMSAWQLRDYGGLDSLELVKNVPVPKISSSKDVLVEVKAASVNVLDAWMPGDDQIHFLKRIVIYIF